MSSSTTSTPYLERLQEGLRQVRPAQMDDLWTTPTPTTSPAPPPAPAASMSTTTATDRNSTRCPWGMDNGMGHLLTENLDWWCSREEMRHFLQDAKRLDRLVHVLVTSAAWMNHQWSSTSRSSSSHQPATTSSNNSAATASSANRLQQQQQGESIIMSSSNHSSNIASKLQVYVSHCVGCNFPFQTSSSCSSCLNNTGAAAVLLPSAVARRERIVSDQQNLELHLHLLIITISVITSLIRHNNDRDDDLTDRLIVLLSVDTPTMTGMSTTLDEYNNNNSTSTSTDHATATTTTAATTGDPSKVLHGPELPSWIEQQLRAGKPQAVIPLLGIIHQQSCCRVMFPKAAVGAAGLLSLITSHRPAVVFSTLQQQQQQQHLDAFIASVYAYLDQLCLPLLRVHHDDATTSSSCLVQERFGLLAFFNILPTLYHLSSWKAVRRHARFDKIVVAFVACMMHICHSATTTTTSTTNNSTDSDNNNSNIHNENDTTNNDGPADLENLVELIGAKFPVLESLILLSAQQPLHQEQSSSLSVPRHDDNDDDVNWRMTLLQQRPMTVAVAAGLEVLSLWARHGVDLTTMAMGADENIQNCNTNNEDTTSTIPRIKKPTGPSSNGDVLLEDDSNKYGNDDDNTKSTMLSIPACLTRYLPRIAILAQRIAPRLGYMETMARSLAAHHRHVNDSSSGSVNTSSSCSKDSSLFLQAAFSVARERCGLPTCRRRQRAVAADQQQQGGDDSTGKSTSIDSCTTTRSLKVCHGGCKGMERYCCRTHQKEHWPIHKLFCKNNGNSNNNNNNKSAF